VRIPAAGTLPWRVKDGHLQVALIHRPRYRDWSWPKGKLDPAEDWPVAAARETAEETGLVVRLGIPLPDATYAVMSRDGTPDTKAVRYWAATSTGRTRRHQDEVDQVAWLDVAAAHARLDYARDRDQLLALTQAHQRGTLDTWPLVVVRHAKAVARSDFRGKNDQRRPLDTKGEGRAADLVALLTAYGISRLVTSPSVRCVDTLAPYAAAARLPLVRKEALSEEGFEEAPEKAPKAVLAALRRGEPTALCSHGPVLPTLVDVLLPVVDEHLPTGHHTCATLTQARHDHLVKGEALVCHVHGTGEHARIVAVERHLP
jgi:8-oxo-dGTP diphosphatase